MKRNVNHYSVLVRLMELRAVLQSEQLDVMTIIERMPNKYTLDESGKRRVRRDIQNLEVLGYELHHEGRPTRWSLVTDIHLYTDEDVEALIHIREAFSGIHPLFAPINQLLAKVTAQLTDEQSQSWQRRPALRMSLKPAIDYTDYSDLIHWLETAIRRSQQIRLDYKSRISQRIVTHSRLDPYEIEFTDGHFYLLAFSYDFGRILTFRIDRIVWHPAQDSPMLYRNGQQLRRTQKSIRFTYRLPASFTDGGISERFTIHDAHQEGDYVIIDASDSSEFRIIRTLLGYGEHAVLMDGPPSLLRKMRKVVRLLAEQYTIQDSE